MPDSLWKLGNWLSAMDEGIKAFSLAKNQWYTSIIILARRRYAYVYYMIHFCLMRFCHAMYLFFFCSFVYSSVKLIWERVCIFATCWKTRKMQHLVWMQKYHWNHSCQKNLEVWFCMQEIQIYCIWPWNLNQNCVYWSLRKNWINSIHHKCDADIAQFLAKWFQTSFVTSIIYYM